MRKNERLFFHTEIATAKRWYDDALGRKIAECKGTRTNFWVSLFSAFLSTATSLFDAKKRARGVRRTRTISAYKRTGIHYPANFSRIETRFFFCRSRSVRFITALKHRPHPPLFVLVKHPEAHRQWRKNMISRTINRKIAWFNRYWSI